MQSHIDTQLITVRDCFCSLLLNEKFYYGGNQKELEKIFPIVSPLIEKTKSLITKEVFEKLLKFDYLLKEDAEKDYPALSKQYFFVLSEFFRNLIVMNTGKKQEIEELKEKKVNAAKEKSKKSDPHQEAEKENTIANLEKELEREHQVLKAHLETLKRYQEEGNLTGFYKLFSILYLENGIPVLSEHLDHITLCLENDFKDYKLFKGNTYKEKIFRLFIHIKLVKLFLNYKKSISKDEEIQDYVTSLNFSPALFEAVISFFLNRKTQEKLLWSRNAPIEFQENSKVEASYMKQVFVGVMKTLYHSDGNQSELGLVYEMVKEVISNLFKNMESMTSMILLDSNGPDPLSIYYTFKMSTILDNDRVTFLLTEFEDKVFDLLLLNHKNPFIFKLFSNLIMSQKDTEFLFLTFLSKVRKAIEIPDNTRNQFALSSVVSSLVLIDNYVSVKGGEVFRDKNNYGNFMYFVGISERSKIICTDVYFPTTFEKDDNTYTKKIVSELIFDTFLNIYISTKEKGVLDDFFSVFIENFQSYDFLVSKMNEIHQKNSTYAKEKEKPFNTLFHKMDILINGIVKNPELDEQAEKITRAGASTEKVKGFNLTVYFLLKIYLYSINEDNILRTYLHFMGEILCEDVYIFATSSKEKYSQNQSNLALFKDFKKKFDAEYIKDKKKRDFNKLNLKLTALFDKIDPATVKDFIRSHPSISCIRGGELKFDPMPRVGSFDSSRSLSSSLKNSNDQERTFSNKINETYEDDDELTLEKKEEAQEVHVRKRLSQTTRVLKNFAKKFISQKSQKNSTTFLPSLLTFDEVNLDKITLNGKKEILMGAFGIFFKDVFFDNELFRGMKTYYCSLKKQNSKTKEMNYPICLKNFSNGFEPPSFFRQDFTFFDPPFFPISHDFFSNKLIEKVELKSINFKKKLTYDFETMKPIQEFECELIKSDRAIFGYLKLYEKMILFVDSQDDPRSSQDPEKKLKYAFRSMDSDLVKDKKKTILMFHDNIKEVLARRFLLIFQAIEIFLESGKSYFINFFHKDKLAEFFATVKKTKIAERLIVEDPKSYFSKKKYKNSWENKEISTYEYLLYVNKYATRTFKDCNQYPVFPWVVREFSENEGGENVLRKFRYPLTLQSEEKRVEAKEKFSEALLSKKFPFHLGSHYSTSSFIYYYLMRIIPFTNSLIKLQSFSQENPNRMFCSIESTQQLLESSNDNREIIPELFSCVEPLVNLNCSYFGKRMNEQIVDDLQIAEKDDINTYTLSNYVNFLIKHRLALNSERVGKEINEWIDWVFGATQMTGKENSCNIFSKLTYALPKNDLNAKIEKLKKKYENDPEMIIQKLYNRINVILNFGQCPFKLFDELHPRQDDVGKKEEQQNDEYDEYESLGRELHLKNLEARQNVKNFVYFGVSSDKRKIFTIFEKKNCIIYRSCFTDDSKEETFVTFPEVCNLILKKMKLYKKLNSNSFKHSERKNSFKHSERKKLEKDFTYCIYSPEYAIIELKSVGYLISCRHLDHTFKIYQTTKKNKSHQREDVICSVACEDFVNAIGKMDEENFLVGLNNGRLIHYYGIKDDEVSEVKSVFAHEGRINTITVKKRLNIVVTSGEDNYIYIRKTYDFELLGVIKVPDNHKVTQIRISKLNFLYALCLNESSLKSCIYGYTLSGMEFAKSEYDYYCNIQTTLCGNILAGVIDAEKICVFKGSDLSPVSEPVKVRYINYNNHPTTKDLKEEEINKRIKSKKIEGLAWFRFLKKKSIFLFMLCEGSFFSIDIEDANDKKLFR